MSRNKTRYSILRESCILLASAKTKRMALRKLARHPEADLLVKRYEIPSMRKIAKWEVTE